MLHHLGRPAVGPDRHPAADHFAEHRQVRRHPEPALRPAVGDAEPAHHLVERQQRAVPRRQLPTGREELVGRQDEAHVAADRFQEHPGDFVRVFVEGVGELPGVVVIEDDRVRRAALRHAGAGGRAEGQRAAAGRHEEGVDVAVIVPGELHHFVPPRGPAGEADGAHGGLGPAVGEPDLVDGRDGVDDEFGEFGLGRGGGAEGGGPGEGVRDRGHDGRVPVAEDVRPPGADEVDVAVAVDVGEERPLAGGHMNGRAADGPERAGRAVHPAGDDFERAAKGGGGVRAAGGVGGHGGMLAP